MSEQTMLDKITAMMGEVSKEIPERNYKADVFLSSSALAALEREFAGACRHPAERHLTMIMGVPYVIDYRLPGKQAYILEVPGE